VILIADSGATKADWRFIDKDGNITSFSSAGLSPLFWTSQEMVHEINKKFPKRVKSQLASGNSKIYFYGTSCSSPARIKIVRIALKKAFPKSRALVSHDILASARALLGNNPGIACILGTGSNSCYYDGKKISKIIGGLTYILGDEGSGGHIGLSFIKAFLNHELPEKVHTTFIKEYRLSKDKILDGVYNKKYPNRFLASFAKFVHEHMDDPFIEKMVKRCMSEFFDKTICRYENYQNLPVGFVGSIAGHFGDVLHAVAKEKGVTINKIINSPVDELVKFHLAKS
jgi:N-acetylglucosamine kinase-like BadF-type ATPase